jgi:hypothetical protein
LYLEVIGLKEYSKHIVVYVVVGVLGVLLGVPSALAQTNQTSQQEQQGGNQTGNQSSAGGQQQQQSEAIPPPDVISPITNETSEGFANTTDVENLTGLNFGGAAEGEGATGGQQEQEQQGGNQTGNQSSAGGQQGPLEQIGEAIGDVFSVN